MPVNSISGVDPALTKPASPNSNKMDKNAFLRLLVTQMTHQDPLNPQDQSQMLSQVAQFSQVETMNNVQEGQSKLQATGLLGKTVSASYVENNAPVSVRGVVTNVTFDASGVSLMVQGTNRPVQLSELTAVQN